MTRRTLLTIPAAAAAAPARRPNIILILADDLGYGDLGCYGNTYIRTPHIDKLAAGGMRFTDFHVSWPACTPSRSTILTGRCPQRNGLYDMIRNNEVDWGYQFDEATYAVSPEMALGLDLREITIGQAMKQAGYATGMVGKWDSGRARRFLPLQRGFDFYYGFANTGIDYFTHKRYGVPSMFRGNDRVQEPGHATDLFRREALSFLRAHRGRPYFFYFASNAPHGASTFDKEAPQAPEEWLQMYGTTHKDRKAVYAALVTQLDAAVGAIVEEVRAAGEEDNTLIVFTSDNGGSGTGHNGPLRGAKGQMFEGGVRVPMIARWPGRFPAGKVCPEFAVTAEFFPTFLASAGAAPPRAVKLDGFNLLPVLEGKGKGPRREFFWQRRNDRAARVDQWKWVDGEKGGGLFDLAADIGEKRDLSKEKPDVLKMMQGRWADWRREMDACEPRGPFRDY